MTLSFKNLEDAYKTLNTCYSDYLNNQESHLLEYICDSCVKRFEYTLETSWKLMKKVFIEKYGKTDEELTINNIFRFMEGYGYAINWQNWKEYYQKRNNTAHEFNFVKSRTLIDVIPNFLDDVKYLLTQINAKELKSLN